MPSNNDIFGFIFDSAKKQKKRSKSEDKFKAKIRGMSSSFEDAVSDMITDMVLDNIDYLAEMIINNDVHGLAARDADLLQLLLANRKSRAVVEGAKKQRRYVKWDTRRILEAVILILSDKGITFTHDEVKWLAKNIHNIGIYIYKS